MERQYLNPVGHNAVDEDIVGMDHSFSRTGNAAGTVEIGMVGQAIGGMPDRIANAVGGRRVPYFDIVDDAFEFA